MTVFSCIDIHMKITHQTEFDLFVALLPRVVAQNPITEPAEVMAKTQELMEKAIEHLEEKGIVKDSTPNKKLSIRPPNRYAEL
jgi:hypothetical protein